MKNSVVLENSSAGKIEERTSVKKAIILAVGEDSRLGRIGERREKCLDEIGGSTLLDRNVASNALL